MSFGLSVISSEVQAQFNIRRLRRRRKGEEFLRLPRCEGAKAARRR